MVQLALAALHHTPYPFTNVSFNKHTLHSTMQSLIKVRMQVTDKCRPLRDRQMHPTPSPRTPDADAPRRVTASWAPTCKSFTWTLPRSHRKRDVGQCQQAPEAPVTDTYHPAPLRRRSPVAEGSEIVLTDLPTLAVTSPLAIFQRFAKGLIILFQSFSRN